MPPNGAERLSQLSQATEVMLKNLSSHFPDRLPELPAPGVSLASLTERTVGLGNQRGAETRGPFYSLFATKPRAFVFLGVCVKTKVRQGDMCRVFSCHLFGELDIYVGRFRLPISGEEVTGS